MKPFFNRNHHLLISSLTLITLGVSGCQSSVTLSPSLTSLSQLPPTSSINAHRLMQQTMLHRFNKSYSFDKITQYQAVPLYNDQDIEAKHDSLFNLMFNGFYGHSRDKDRHLSKEQLACEDSYNEAFNKTLDEFSEDSLDEKQVTEQQTQQQASYEACMATAPAYVSPDKLAEKHAEAKRLGDDDEATITEDNPQAKRREDFQEAMKKTIEKLDELEARQAKAERKKNDGDASRRYGMTRFLGNLKITPEQIEVVNQSFLQNQRLRYSGFYDQKKGQFSTVLEEHRKRSGVENYRRVPVLLDLHEMSITLEPDVALPFAGIMFDKPLPDIAGKSVKFTLPANLRQNIPLPVLKDSLVNAIGKAYGDIDAEKFNEVVLDEYARSLHASRVIKINMGVQEMSFLMARSIKYWVADLNQIALQHPDYIKNDSDFKLALELMTKLNRHYRADDIAHLAKIVEAFLPVNFNGYNYYYFDSQNNLIGYRKSRDYSSGLLNGKLVATTVNTISYQPVTNNALFYQPTPADTVDGNALVDSVINDKKLEAVARDARFEYDMSDLDKADKAEKVATSLQCNEIKQEYDKLTLQENATEEETNKAVALAVKLATECQSKFETNVSDEEQEKIADARAEAKKVAESASPVAESDPPSEDESETKTDDTDNDEESDYQRGSNRKPSYHLSSHMESGE